MEGHSTVEDRLPRNSCRQVCCVFVARAASGCRWNETSADDDQRQTEDDSHHHMVQSIRWTKCFISFMTFCSVAFFPWRFIGNSQGGRRSPLEVYQISVSRCWISSVARYSAQFNCCFQPSMVSFNTTGQLFVTCFGHRQ